MTVTNLCAEKLDSFFFSTQYACLIIYFIIKGLDITKDIEKNKYEISLVLKQHVCLNLIVESVIRVCSTSPVVTSLALKHRLSRMISGHNIMP